MFSPSEQTSVPIYYIVGMSITGIIDFLVLVFGIAYIGISNWAAVVLLASAVVVTGLLALQYRTYRHVEDGINQSDQLTNVRRLGPRR
jgi:purine-cytosine permease-like protein